MADRCTGCGGPYYSHHIRDGRYICPSGTIKRQVAGPVQGNLTAPTGGVRGGVDLSVTDFASGARLSSPRPVASPYVELDPYTSRAHAGMVWQEVALVRLPIRSGFLEAISGMLRDEFPERGIEARECPGDPDCLTFGWWLA